MRWREKKASRKSITYYKDSRKAGLQMLLLKIHRMLLMIEELRSIDEDVKQLTDSLNSMEKIEQNSEYKTRLHSLAGDIVEKSFNYQDGVDGSGQIRNILDKTREFLLEIWPKD